VRVGGVGEAVFMLAYPAVILCLYWARTKDWKRCLYVTGIVAAAMAMMVAPWTYRNYRHFGRFIPVSYNMGYNRLVNNNAANVHGRWMDLSGVPLTPKQRAEIERGLAGGRSVKEAHELEQMMAQAGMEWIKQNPAAFMELGFMRVYTTFFKGAADISIWAMNDWDFSEADEEARYKAERRVNLMEALFATTAVVFSTVGFLYVVMQAKPYVKALFTLDKNRAISDAVNIVWMNTAFFVAVVFLFEGQERYNYPLALFFIYAMITIWNQQSSPTLLQSKPTGQGR
jgi:hypothetical protein